VVAVAASPAKTPAFTLDQRLALIREVLADVPECEVAGYDGLTVQVARAHNTGVIVRGLRAAGDFEFEFQLASMNRHLDNEVETVFLTPSEQHMFISSSLVREIAAMHGDMSEFVHPVVNQALVQRFS
jgi:pantetheine-phosphate adenylyltransferase